LSFAASDLTIIDLTPMETVLKKTEIAKAVRQSYTTRSKCFYVYLAHKFCSLAVSTTATSPQRVIFCQQNRFYHAPVWCALQCWYSMARLFPSITTWYCV